MTEENQAENKVENDEVKEAKEETKEEEVSSTSKEVLFLEESESAADRKTNFMQLYASLMILLMTFFIVLVSMSQPSAEKFADVKGGLSDSMTVLGVPEADESQWLLRSISNLSRTVGNFVAKEEKEEEPTSANDSQAEEKDEEEEAKKEEEAQDKFFEEGYSQLKIVVSSEMVFFGGEVERKGEDLYIRLPAKNLFQTGDVKMQRESLPSLKQISKLLQKEDFSLITIRCFTDERSALEEEGFSYLGLSCLRGNAIGKFLHKEGGIPLKKIRNVGFGNARHSKGKVFNNSVELVIN
ncbi:flagellar motor protein MotB [Candidatus Auribacterota bacterium]